MSRDDWRLSRCILCGQSDDEPPFTDKDASMPSRLPRRLFLARSGRTALGLPLLSLAACSHPPVARGESAEDPPTALTAELEAQIPSLLAAAHVPGLSIAIVRHARM